MTDIFQQIPKQLQDENGLGEVCCIWRERGSPNCCPKGVTVGEFLSDPANQSGLWLIDGGWGGPPGPIYVRWNGTFWENGGFHGHRF